MNVETEQIQKLTVVAHRRNRIEAHQVMRGHSDVIIIIETEMVWNIGWNRRHRWPHRAAPPGWITIVEHYEIAHLLNNHSRTEQRGAARQQHALAPLSQTRQITITDVQYRGTEVGQK